MFDTHQIQPHPHTVSHDDPQEVQESSVSHTFFFTKQVLAMQALLPRIPVSIRMRPSREPLPRTSPHHITTDPRQDMHSLHGSRTRPRALVRPHLLRLLLRRRSRHSHPPVHAPVSSCPICRTPVQFKYTSNPYDSNISQATVLPIKNNMSHPTECCSRHSTSSPHRFK